MNFLGIMFTFMIPGAIIGGLLALGMYAEAGKVRRKPATAPAASLPARKLYIHTLSEETDCVKRAA